MSIGYELIAISHKPFYRPYERLISRDYYSVSHIQEDINNGIENESIRLIKNGGVVVIYSQSKGYFYVVSLSEESINNYYKQYVLFTLEKTREHYDIRPLEEYVYRQVQSVGKFVELINQDISPNTIPSVLSRINKFKYDGIVVIYSQTKAKYYILYTNEDNLENYFNRIQMRISSLRLPEPIRPISHLPLFQDTIQKPYIDEILPLTPKKIDAVFFDFDLTLTPKHTRGLPNEITAQEHLYSYPTEMNFMIEYLSKLRNHMDIYILSRGVVNNIKSYIRYIRITDQIIPDENILGAENKDDINPYKNSFGDNEKYWAEQKKILIEKTMNDKEYSNVIFIDDTKLNTDTAKTNLNIICIEADPGNTIHNIKSIFDYINVPISLVGGEFNENYKDKYSKYKTKYIELKLEKKIKK